VQVSSAFNDENQTAHQHGPAVLKDAVLQTSKQQASLLKSTRKAFGNITNTQPREVAQQPETVKRRAFGDITYSVHKQQAANKSSLKPNIGTALKPSDIKPGPVTSLDTQQLSVPAWCATEPVERPAGKTWDQLQADRYDLPVVARESCCNNYLQAQRLQRVRNDIRAHLSLLLQLQGCS